MKKKVFILLIGSLFISGSFYGYYLYNKPHKDIQNSQANLYTAADELIAQFVDNKKEISDQLINKVIEITGIVTTVEKTPKNIVVVMNQGIKFELDKENTEIANGQTIKIKGVYSGFDEMFNEITLVRCYLTN